MSKAVRRANEQDATRLRNGIVRQIASLAAAIDKLREERNAKLDIDKAQLAAIEAALTADDAAAEKVDA